MLSIEKKLNWLFCRCIVIPTVSLLICIFTLFDLPAYSEVYDLPSADKILPVSADTSSPILKGIKIDPANPFRIEFIIDQKNASLLDRDEAHRLVSYFFAALTVPEADLWVNLSPYESERIIPGALGITDMGKDMLGQDYILKQLVSSLTYPESASGKKYWETVYKQVYLLAGKTDIAVNTFNKVWIVPAHARIHENGNVAILVSSRLKALTEEDYTALAKNRADTKQVNAKDISRVAAQALKETLLSQIEWDINHGEHFNRLRQLYSSFVLAAWFKHKMQDTIFQYYIDHNKVKGIDLSDKSAKEKIYNLYTSAFNKGVYSYVKREFDQNSRKIMRRQYFSGGIAISTDEAIRQPAPLSVAERDCQRIEHPATLVVDVTKADSRSPFEITEQEVRSRDIASLMEMIDRIFPVSDPANSEINAIIKGLLNAQLAKVDNISVLVPDADHLFRALENIKSFYTKNDILRGKMMAAFGGGDNDKTLNVLTVAILLSKIGFGHPEIDPTQRKTLENNRLFAAELLEPVKKKLGDALGLTPEQTDSFITAIRYQGSYGVSSTDYSNPLTTLLTLASELDITRDRLQGWQAHKPLLRVLLRVASNPEVVALYTEMTQLNLTLQAAQGEDAVAVALRKKNEYGRAFDKRLS